MKDRLKDLLRRAVGRARVSPNPLVRVGVELAQQGFRFVGLIAPGLHLGWMSSLRDARWDGDDLVLRGWSFVRGSVHGGSPRHEVYLRRPGRPVWLGGRGAKAVTRHVPDPDVLGGSARAELDYSGSTWEARFPAAQLAKLPPGRWDLYSKVVRDIRRSWGPVRNAYVFGTPATIGARPVGDLLVRPIALPDGAGVHLDVEPPGRPDQESPGRAADVPYVVEVDTAVRDGDVLRLTGSLDGDPDGFDLVLAAARAEIPVSIDEVSPDGRFVATAPLRVSSWGGPELPPKRGAYALEGRLKGAADESARFGTFVTDRYTQTVPTIDARDDLRLRFELNARPQLLVRVTRPRAADEYGAHNQRLLFKHFALGPAEPLDAVYFESFFGRSATCNPRAIDAEVARRRPDLPRYWSVDDRSIAVPEGAIPLVIGTREWWRVRESARWIVTNEWLRGRYVKKPFQTVLQTWHGSMYKRIGIDRGGSGWLRGGHTDRARAERANWDMFISQNGDTTPIIQQAYEFQGDDASAVLEIGYPRNDELVPFADTPTLELVERVARVRERIGIPDGRRVIMYAPTWREASQNVELLSLVQLAREVGEGFTFLQRGHVRTLEEGESVASDAVIDVSTYPQINELYMVSDLLITDYSSMMFDYSVTRRPMLFYTPDIEEYTDPKVRGAYFDLEEVAPGPVVRTVPEVIELLRTIDAWSPTFADRYAAWHDRFNHHDDGHASARAVDALFTFDPSTRGDTHVRRTYDPGAGEEA
ncbi:MAG TPA: CDP-glycerol glycerophosphotransferase family protein [Aeromicrobium sp.]|nr:CDP-glycerol glycerophosphotransferase family protein [Aeromicrobium sp.]